MYITILSTSAFSVAVNDACPLLEPWTNTVGADVYPAPALVTATAVIIPSESIVAVAVATFAKPYVGLFTSGSVFSGSLITITGSA